MKKNKSKQFILAALSGLLLFTPVQTLHIQETAYAAQVSDPHDSRLSAFDIAPGVLTPAFSPDILEYTSTVDSGVTRVSVQAVPRSSNSVIASVEGRDGLQPGVNTIKVVCSAQDNTSTTYTITLTVGSAGAQSQPDAGNEAGQQPDAGGTDEQPDAGSEGENPEEKKNADNGKADGQAGGSAAASKLLGPVAADGTVSLNGAAYKLSNNFTYGSTTQDIPSGFGEGSLQIGENSYQTLYCEANGVHLVYMENTDGNGSSGFYYYDEIQNAAERFKYTGIGDNFVVFISSARQELPQGYQETTLTLPSGKETAAAQNVTSDELQDYYLIYGINSDGTDGWYLYDNSQGTYMRYASAFAAQSQGEDEQEEVARTVSLTKYNSLNEKYTELKENRVKLVSIFVIVILLLIIAFTAVLLRSQDDGDEDGEEQPERERAKKKTKKTKKKMAAVSKSSLAAGRDFEGLAGKRAKKVTKNITQEPENEATPQAEEFSDGITPPDKIREQAALERDQGSQTQRTFERRGGQKQQAYEQKLSGQRAYDQKLSGQQAYEQKLNEQKTYEQKLREQRAYEQKLSGQRAYEQKPGGQRMHEQKAYEQNLGEQRTYEQKPGGQRAYEQKPGGQRAYEQKPGGQRTYEQKPGGQRAYEQKLSEQRAYEQKAYEQKPGEQRAYEQKPGEQRAYEQKLSEQRAYEQKLSEQRAYEQKLSEQRAYEQKLNEQRAMEQRSGRRGTDSDPQEDSFDRQGDSVNLLRKNEPAGSTDSVQLAAERMRQSMRFSREVPKAEPVQKEPEHDPMDDWDMEETASRKPQKNTRAAKKKRRSMNDDMEIMDLNDL